MKLHFFSKVLSWPTDAGFFFPFVPGGGRGGGGLSNERKNREKWSPRLVVNRRQARLKP